MRLGETFGLPLESLKPYHEKIYLLSQLSELIGEYGIPEDSSNPDYSNYAQEPFEKYIEVQVWSDVPVQKFLPAE